MENDNLFLPAKLQEAQNVIPISVVNRVGGVIGRKE